MFDIKTSFYLSLEINRGMVIFVAFLKDAQLDDVEKLGMKTLQKVLFYSHLINLAKEIATVRLCESENGSKTIVDLPGDLLIIPQATLGGRLNSHRFQYHYNISKETGQEFYDKLVAKLREFCSQNKDNVVHAGSYGIRQIYSSETNGPAMHIIEF